MSKPAIIDFETRSACSLRNSGSWRYSLDPSTEVLCMAFRLPHWPEGRTALWHPAFQREAVYQTRVSKKGKVLQKLVSPALDIPERWDAADMIELFQWIDDGGLVEAHNAWFERGIWTNKMTTEHFFPPIHTSQWRCSAAKAASHALPRNLDDANRVMKLSVLKDMEGSKIMKKLTKPRKARKAEVETAEEMGVPVGVLYFESREMFDTLCAYCRQDVLAEEALGNALPEMNGSETALYLIDQTVNERGFGLDREAIETALWLIDQETVRFNAELYKVTNHCVEKATQRDALKAWLETEGTFLVDTKKDTLDTLMASQEYISPRARRALEIMRELGRSSTAKYKAMQNWICPDDRAHGGLLFHGASTGRWTGAGVQPQNFPRGTIKDTDAAWTILKSRDRKKILAHTALDKKGVPYNVFPSIMEGVSGALRGAIVPTPGHWLYVADYAAIEARVLLWLANDHEGLKLFAPGLDIYSEMASSVYEYPCGKETHPEERKLGKVAVLGLGYQMGWEKFIDTCMVMAKIEIGEELARKTVDAYRAKFWRVKQMWWDMEAAAIECLLTRKSVECGKVLWSYRAPFLYCELPSGRRLAYPYPEVHERPVPWGGTKDSLTYMGINSYSHKWQRQHSYGGLLVENVDQAVARDLIAHALVECEYSVTYQPVLSVHDEIIAEALLGTGDVHEFEQLVSSIPRWAKGCPVAAEGWRGVRYRK